jgi:hypothetical protein
MRKSWGGQVYQTCRPELETQPSAGWNVITLCLSHKGESHVKSADRRRPERARSMSEQTTTILCGSCRVPVEGPAEPKDEDAITCPSSGRSDNFKNVMVSVTACVQELAGKALQKVIRESVARSKFIQVKTKPIPKGNYPFVVDLKL